MTASSTEKLAEALLDCLGGSANIKDVRYCSTRLRFRLKKKSRVDSDRLKMISGIAAAAERNGQYQLVLVHYKTKDVYDALTDNGLKGVGMVDAQDAWIN
ncbi:PTS transporter subunit EIIB [Streptococcus pantholopis]|uniref:PTS EIIB type-1 domain-containing protein n=1 Tax=Streptococcus pantholopis TaxID=1811193 RepID=A0A172Q6E5_9STRE|nr:PTS transporter subunit EIIB [Streptococcus pantholopis]AND79021.1 hypothetical protein A0O21_02780 [Streptococcus pantholopis]